jgi:hypothetical protein
MTTRRLAEQALSFSIVMMTVTSGATYNCLAAMQQTGPGVRSPDKSLTFDVASVKPATVPSGMIPGADGRRAVQKGSGAQVPRNTGGPGTDDHGRIRYPPITLKELLKRGWDSYYEIESPGWLDTQVVAIDAAMPPDTSQAQFQEMLRNLITERFGLKSPATAKEVAALALTVGKGGPKMSEWRSRTKTWRGCLWSVLRTHFENVIYWRIIRRRARWTEVYGQGAGWGGRIELFTSQVFFGGAGAVHFRRPDSDCRRTIARPAASEALLIWSNHPASGRSVDCSRPLVTYYLRCSHHPSQPHI